LPCRPQWRPASQHHVRPGGAGRRAQSVCRVHNDQDCRPVSIEAFRIALHVFTARCYASAVLAMGMCPYLSVDCLSQVGVLSKRWNESSWFWHTSFLPPVLHCVKRKFGYLQKKGTSLWNFVLNSGLRHGRSIVETCYQFSSRKVDAQSVINWWAVVGQLSR